jgi:coenzyme F420-reducing hydrogenase alpha subunit
MAQEPRSIKLFQIEEPGGVTDAADGLGMAVGIELSRGGVAVAASVGGNAELLVRPETGGLASNLTEAALSDLLRDLRSLSEKAAARPVTHAVIRLGGFDLSDDAIVRAGAKADLAVLGVRREGNALDAAIEAEDIAGVLSA